MMFVILTHDNQSILTSFSELLSFVTNSPMAEEALSGSTDVALFVSKAWYSFARLFDLFLVASKRLIEATRKKKDSESQLVYELAQNSL